MGIKKYLRRYLSEYLNTTIIYFMDIFLSAVASGMVLVLSTLLYDPVLQKGFILLWLLASVIGSAVSFYVSQSYRIIIRHSTLVDLGRFSWALFLKALIMFLAMTLVFGFKISTVMLLVLDFAVSMLIIFIVRMLMLRVYEQFKSRGARSNSINVLVYGTSDKSVALATRLANSPHYNVRGFLVEGEAKQRAIIMERPVFRYSDERSLFRIINMKSISGLLFATEKEAFKKQNTLIKFAVRNKVKILLSPTIDEMVGGHLVHNRVREIKIEDLLGRKEIKISEGEVMSSIKGKTVLVTGAAGSIGSELCRKLANFEVGQLILFDNAETPMHNLRLELQERFPELKFVPVIGDVRIPARLDYVFRKWNPQLVFHAAAYKHVPLMEENPCEAVLVNVAGSRNVADKCVEYGVEKMVMISTDKAVNPTNIMGCTKRLAEIYVQSLAQAVGRGEVEGATRFVTTRFGNVLGSNGSVIPRFREQIENGGPVTVTDKNITRFFMTIPEACSLVLEAAILPAPTSIFAFDMGASVKIDDLARNMIELAGFVPDVDIKIEYTGLRPGEKLYEEVLSNAETTLPTSHDRIRIAKVREYDYQLAKDYVARLENLSRAVEIPDVVKLMKEIVPEFKSQNSVFEKYDK